MPSDTPELVEALHFARENHILVHILGGGTNLLVRDSLIPGIVVCTKRMKRVIFSGTDLMVQAGASLPRLVRAACDRGLSGLEALAGIPGTIGGAVFMNAGGKYGNIAPVVESISTVTLDGEQRLYERSNLKFAYRRGPVADEIITDVNLTLYRSTEERVKSLTTNILRDKAAKQPLTAMSAGCIFKNPGGAAAGKLIDECGLKGQTCGKVEISPIHANFIVNAGGGTAFEVNSLIHLARRSVAEKFGIELELEISVI